VEGVRGRVDMEMELVVRFDYGRTAPWVMRSPDSLRAVAGDNVLYLQTPVETHGRDLTTQARFSVRRGERVPFVLIWSSARAKVPKPLDATAAIERTERWWRGWAARCDADEYRELVVRSLITLKALTYSPTGAMVAAPTTS